MTIIDLVNAVIDSKNEIAEMEQRAQNCLQIAEKVEAMMHATGVDMTWLAEDARQTAEVARRSALALRENLQPYEEILRDAVEVA